MRRMTDKHYTLDELRRITDPEKRIAATTAYIEYAEQKVREARLLRDDDIRALVKKHGPAEAARRSGMSLSTVKMIRGRA